MALDNIIMKWVKTCLNFATNSVKPAVDIDWYDHLTLLSLLMSLNSWCKLLLDSYIFDIILLSRRVRFLNHFFDGWSVNQMSWVWTFSGFSYRTSAFIQRQIKKYNYTGMKMLIFILFCCRWGFWDSNPPPTWRSDFSLFNQWDKLNTNKAKQSGCIN